MRTELIYEFYIMLRITSDYYLHIVYRFFLWFTRSIFPERQELSF